MNVADRGAYITLLYIKMNAYIIVSLIYLTNLNELCSNEGLQYVSVSIKGAIGLIILNFVAFVYVKAKERMQLSDIILLIFINLCWILMEFVKSYQISLSSPNECQYVINTQQIICYLHITTTIWAVLQLPQVFSLIIIRITCLPINCLSLYLILVNNKQECMDQNMFYLLILSVVWLTILGIPYNFIISINKKIIGPYTFLVIVGVLIQLGLNGLIYLSWYDQQTQKCNINNTSQKLHLIFSCCQFITTLFYFIYYRKFEKERIIATQKELQSLTNTTRLSTTLYTLKK